MISFVGDLPGICISDTQDTGPLTRAAIGTSCAAKEEGGQEAEEEGLLLSFGCSEALVLQSSLPFCLHTCV